MRMSRMLRMVYVLTAIGLLFVFLSADTSSLAQSSAAEQRVEIVIQDNAFELRKPTPVRPGLPTVIILRNQDIVRHGFTSPLFLGLLINGEGEGVISYGKGVEGFYVDPGKTLIIRFTNDRPGKFSFKCDLHPQMKSEIYMMEIPTA
jgi:plastocyanin